MIKIELDNIETIKKDHFEGIKQLILDRARFYLIVFKVIDNQPGFDIAAINSFAVLHTLTKTALLKVVVKNKKTFKNQTHYTRLTKRSSIVKHFYDHRAGFIHLLTELSDEKKLRQLILAEVDNLMSVNASFNQPWSTTKTVELIREIISYDTFNKKETTPYNAYDLTRNLRVDVCVYCNRGYINTVISEKGKKVIKATLDHFFLQQTYPLLALSFYNLIPSCYFCNANLKGSINFDLDWHIHPYKEGFGQEATFDYLQTGLLADKSDARNYKVILKNNAPGSGKNQRIFGNGIDARLGNNNVFSLEEVYQSHTDIVGELIVKSDRLSPYYAGNMIKMLASLGASKKEFYRFYFSNYLEEKNFNKRPLAKLTKDILAKYLPELVNE